MELAVYSWWIKFRELIVPTVAHCWLAGESWMKCKQRITFCIVACGSYGKSWSFKKRCDFVLSSLWTNYRTVYWKSFSLFWPSWYSNSDSNFCIAWNAIVLCSFDLWVPTMSWRRACPMSSVGEPMKFFVVLNQLLFPISDTQELC